MQESAPILHPRRKIPVFAIVLGALILVGLLAKLVMYVRDPTGSDVNDMTWKEVVDLASGESVEIHRHVHFRQYGIWQAGGIASAPSEVSVWIDLPSDTSFEKWSAPMSPMLLDRDPESKEWLIVAADYGSYMWEPNGGPCPPQWAFRLRNGRWQLEPIPENLLGRMPNLLMDIRVSDDAQFDPVTFEIEARGRKRIQAPHVGLPYGQNYVGDPTVHEILCKNVSPPQFTREFTVRGGLPSIADFPRTEK